MTGYFIDSIFLSAKVAWSSYLNNCQLFRAPKRTRVSQHDLMGHKKKPYSVTHGQRLYT